MDAYANAEVGIRRVFCTPEYYRRGYFLEEIRIKKRQYMHIYQKEYHMKHREKINKRNLNNYYKNKKAKLAWRKDNPELWSKEQNRRKEYNQHYRQQNQTYLKYYETIRPNKEERQKEVKIWYYANHHWYRKIQTQRENIRNTYRRKVDENFRIKGRLRSMLSNALILYGKGKKMQSNKYGIDFEAIIKHLGSRPSKEHSIDHIKSLSLFDFTDPNQVKEAFAPENHRWLLLKENIGRGGINRPKIRKEFHITNYSRPRTLKIDNIIIPNILENIK